MIDHIISVAVSSALLGGLVVGIGKHLLANSRRIVGAIWHEAGADPDDYEVRIQRFANAYAYPQPIAIRCPRTAHVVPRVVVLADRLATMDGDDLVVGFRVAGLQAELVQAIGFVEMALEPQPSPYAGAGVRGEN